MPDRILDLMHSALTTLTSICEDTLNSINNEQIDLKPFNQQFINEEYLNKISINIDENLSSYSSTTNFKQLFRTTHLHVSHSLRSSLWFNLLHRDQIGKQYKFQQPVERYPEDIRYVIFNT
jgi:hypothetical protein